MTDIKCPICNGNNFETKINSVNKPSDYAFSYKETSRLEYDKDEHNLKCCNTCGYMLFFRKKV